MARDFGGKPLPGVKIPAARRAGGGTADNAALENALRIIRGSDLGGSTLSNVPGLTQQPGMARGILPGESAGIPTKMGQRGTGMPQGLADILSAAAAGATGGGLGSAVGGQAGGYLGTGIAVLMQLLKDRGKKKAAPASKPSSTPGKKGGGPVKGKTKNQKMPQIPKGTPRGPASTYKAGGMMKGGKAKGCK